MLHESLPIPPALLSFPLGGGGGSNPHWLYPFHLMAPGDVTFVTDSSGISTLAERAVRTYREQLKASHSPARFSMKSVHVLGVSGLRIARVR